MDVIILKDNDLNVVTYDFEYKDVTDELANKLPGSQVKSSKPPPPRYQRGAVHAHVNTRRVANFIREKLKRRGIDGDGLAYISSVNCCHKSFEGKQWPNAAWYGKYRQVVYGQKELDGRLTSYASSLTTVSHEIFHGITHFTSRLENRDMPGALNESYSDIFGVIIGNYYDEAVSWDDPATWNWQIGKDLSPDGTPVRDMARPSDYGHPDYSPQYPDHMDRYVKLSSLQDYGGIHINNNIHNKAAYNLMTSGAFTPDEFTELFFNTLISKLSRKSTFTDSLTGLILTTRTRFRNDDEDDLESKVSEIREAFGKVGIYEVASVQ